MHFHGFYVLPFSPLPSYSLEYDKMNLKFFVWRDLKRYEHLKSVASGFQMTVCLSCLRLTISLMHAGCCRVALKTTSVFSHLMQARPALWNGRPQSDGLKMRTSALVLLWVGVLKARISLGEAHSLKIASGIHEMVFQVSRAFKGISKSWNVLGTIDVMPVSVHLVLIKVVQCSRSKTHLDRTPILLGTRRVIMLTDKTLLRASIWGVVGSALASEPVLPDGLEPIHTEEHIVKVLF